MSEGMLHAVRTWVMSKLQASGGQVAARPVRRAAVAAAASSSPGAVRPVGLLASASTCRMTVAVVVQAQRRRAR